MAQELFKKEKLASIELKILKRKLKRVSKHFQEEKCDIWESVDFFFRELEGYV